MIVNKPVDGLGCLDDLLDFANLLGVHHDKVDVAYSTWCSKNMWRPPLIFIDGLIL